MTASSCQFTNQPHRVLEYSALFNTLLVCLPKKLVDTKLIVNTNISQQTERENGERKVEKEQRKRELWRYKCRQSETTLVSVDSLATMLAYSDSQSSTSSNMQTSGPHRSEQVFSFYFIFIHFSRDAKIRVEVEKDTES